MVDKVKPLKYETSVDGTEVDFSPTETDPSEDRLSAKGIAFENLNEYRLEKLGRLIHHYHPDPTHKITYKENGDVDYVEIFNGTQITANRIAKYELAYSGFDPSTETLKIYDTDGTTVLRTITRTLSFSGLDLSTVVEAAT